MELDHLAFKVKVDVFFIALGTGFRSFPLQLELTLFRDQGGATKLQLKEAIPIALVLIAKKT